MFGLFENFLLHLYEILSYLMIFLMLVHSELARTMYDATIEQESASVTTSSPPPPYETLELHTNTKVSSSSYSTDYRLRSPS